MKMKKLFYSMLAMLFMVSFYACEDLEPENPGEVSEGLPDEIEPGSGVTYTIQEDIDNDLVLPNQIDDSEQPDYIVTNDIEVSAKLTIEPGVRIEFEDDLGMEFTSEGNIIAVGTESEKIVFTSNNPDAGLHWKGLVIYSGYSTNELTHAEVSYAGSSRLSYENSSYRTANIVVSADAKLAVTHSLISNGEEEGMYVAGELEAFEQNTFENNGSYAVSVPFNEVGKIDANTNIEDNGDQNYIRVYESQMSDDQAMVALMNDQYYRVTGTITLAAKLNIAAGVKMVFDEDVFFRVDQEDGNLIVEGSETDKVIMTSSNIDAGIYWGGLDIGSGYSTNKLDHAEVSYAGSARIFYENSSYRYANIGIQSSGQITITNTLIGNGEEEGIYAAAESLIDFSNNSFEGNSGYAISIDFNDIGKIDGATTFSGNGDDGVRVYGSTLEDDQEITKLDGESYYLFTDDVTVAGAIDIDAGTQLYFDQDVMFTINENGQLSAVGTSTDPIVFTSSNQSANIHWAGILFSSTVSNEMQYVEVTYGGSARLDYFDSAYRYANIALHNSSLDMNDCTLTDSEVNGIVIGSNSSINGVTVVDTNPENSISAANSISGNSDTDVVFTN